MLRSLRFSLVLGAATAVSCSSPSSSSEAPSEVPSRVTQPIVGGQRNTTAEGVVLVLIQHPVNPTEETSFMCTGTVVSPHVVLTSAHCLDERVVGDGQSFAVFFGDDIDDAVKADDSKYYGYAKSVTVHPDFDPSKVATAAVAEHDIGVIVLLDGAITTPRELQRERLATEAIGRELHVLGYGMTTPKDPQTSGRRNELRTPLAFVSDVYIGTEPTESGICEGDSGGASFIEGVDGIWRVAGVHSYGEHSAECTGKNYDTRVDTHAEWIDTFIRKADPGYLPDVAPPEAEDAGAGEAAPEPQPAPAEKSCSVSTGVRGDGASASAPLWIGIAGAVILARRRRTR